MDETILIAFAQKLRMELGLYWMYTNEDAKNWAKNYIKKNPIPVNDDVAKERENVIKYGMHLPDCNKMKDWNEALMALASTPDQYRDEGFSQAQHEIEEKMNTCTCGFEAYCK